MGAHLVIHCSSHSEVLINVTSVEKSLILFLLFFCLLCNMKKHGSVMTQQKSGSFHAEYSLIFALTKY